MSKPKKDSLWRKAKLGDTLDKIVGGGTPSKAEPSYWDGDIPWASVKDMADGMYHLSSTVDHITESGLKNSATNLIPKRTVVISTRMGLGRCFRANTDIAINQDLKALFPNELLSPDFLLWLMVYLGPNIEGIGTGTTVKGIRLEQLRDLDIFLPPLPTQRKIASILSAYDDLIENNSRRIKILEEMAKMIYREWFVKFRFPGHEKVKMVDFAMGRMPEEWKVVKVMDVADVNRAQINVRTAPDEIHYIDISSVSPGQIDAITTYAFTNAPGRARRVVNHGDVIWSCVRPNRRSHALVMHPEPNTIASTGFAVLTATKVPFTFLYFSTTTEDFVSYLTNNATGAAYPAVATVTFEKAELIISPMPLLMKFGDATVPIADEIHKHQRQIQNLRQTRDLLLPRLISGEVGVEKIDISSLPGVDYAKND